MSFDVDDWYRNLLTWMREERGSEMLEVLSDVASELYCNALVALHLRRYGRSLGRRLWWARCEWEKVDISFGDARHRFDNWNAAWAQGVTGDEGQIEAKVLYWDYDRAKKIGILKELRKQLYTRRRKDIKRGRYGQQYLGLVWLVSYEDESPRAPSELRAQRSSYKEWAEMLADNGLSWREVPVDRLSGALFDHVKTLDMNEIWPLSKPRTASLWVTLLEAMPS